MSAYYVRFRVRHPALDKIDLSEILGITANGDPNWYVEGDGYNLETTISFRLYGYKTHREALEYALKIVDLTSTWPTSNVVEFYVSED